MISNTQVSYRATTKTRTESRVVAELRRGEVLPGTSDYWEGVTMRVPAVPPTKLASTSCSIIDVQYQLAFHVEPSGIGFDLVVGLHVFRLVPGTHDLNHPCPGAAAHHGGHDPPAAVHAHPGPAPAPCLPPRPALLPSPAH